ncbi:UNVERIFIED_CONTAM: hypothetical protein Sangu_3057700, partial [Sesamum angustifolium]
TARGDRRREFIDLRYLRPWARHVLTQEESQALVQSVTREVCHYSYVLGLHQWEPSRFLQGFQGVKTRGSDVPVLVRLIMEVLQLMLLQLIDQNEGFSFHWRCKELGLFQLCFADDLLLFCKADVASVRLFRHGLAEFAKLSGLHANPQKSQLILSRSAHDVREQLLAALHFQEGHLPLRSHQSGGKKDAYLLVERKLSSGISKGGMECGVQTDRGRRSRNPG